MGPIYLGDLIPSIASFKYIIEKYDNGIKEGDFLKNLLAEILITLIGKYAYNKNYLCPCRLDKRVEKM